MENWLQVVVYDIYVALFDKPHRGKLEQATHIRTHIILYMVQNIRWPFAGGKCMPHTLSVSGFASARAVWTRAFMLAIYKIAITHIILFLHHRCCIIYTYLQMDTNASHADKTELQLACVFSLIRVHQWIVRFYAQIQLEWVWNALQSCSILHLGFVRCRMVFVKVEKNDLYFIIIIDRQ